MQGDSPYAPGLAGQIVQVRWRQFLSFFVKIKSNIRICFTDAFIIYPDKKGYIAINAYDWLEDEKLYVYVSQDAELAAFTDFFLHRFATK